VNTYGTQTVNGAKTFTTAPTFSTALLGGSGGTGITTFGAANRIPYAASTTALTTSANLSYNGSILRVNQIAIGDTANSTSGLINLLSISGEGAGFTLKSTYYAPTLRSFSFLVNAVGNAGFWNNNTSSYSYFIENATNNIGIGTVTPTQKLHVVGNGLFTGSINATTDGTTAFVANTSSTTFNGGYSIKLNGVEKARHGFNTDLGAYLYSPTFSGYTITSDLKDWFKIASTGAATFSSSVTAQSGTFSATAGTVLNVVSTNATDDNILLVRGNNGSNFGITVKGTGNVGIGTTSPISKLDVVVTDGNYITISPASGTNNTNSAGIRILGVNGVVGRAVGIYNYNDGSTDNNNMLFYTNYATTFSEKMRITSGGNVGIGTTSPSSKLEIFQATYTGSTNYVTKNIKINSGFGSGYAAGAIVSLLSGYDGTTIYGTDIGHSYDGTGYSLIFSTNNDIGGDVIERMRITRTGNVGIGVTPNTDIASVFRGFQFPQGGSFLSRNDLPLLFFGTNIITNETATVRQVNGRGARLALNAFNDIGYDFWIETVPYSTAGTSGSPVRKIVLSSGGQFGIGDNIESTQKLDVDGNARIRGLANASNPVNVQVDVNGVLVRTSSIELKDDVQNLPYGLNDLLLLKPYKFNYKDKYKYGEGYDIGFIAEDVNDIIPEAVGTGVNSDIFMDSVKLIPILTKAIQEQNLLIKALEQRIINLENK